MKTILAILFGSMLATQAASLTFVWTLNDPRDNVREYRIYERQGTNSAFIASAVDTNRLSVSNVFSGVHTYYLTATNSGLESIPSADATVTILPGQPSGLVIITNTTASVTLEVIPEDGFYVQASEDLLSWIDAVRGEPGFERITLQVPTTAPRRFFRLLR